MLYSPWVSVQLIVLVLFALFQVGLGVFASARIANREDFFVAGRRLGTPLVAFSLFATWFGAETCLGVSGAVYREGLRGARADPFGYALCLVLLGVFFARRLSELKLLTLADLYRKAYGRTVERLLVVVLVPSGLLWGAAQIKAMGQVLAHLVSIEAGLATFLAALVAVLYTLFGGLWGDVLTDLFQGVLLMLGLGALAFVILGDQGVRTAAALEPTRWSLGFHDATWFEQLDRWSVPILGSLMTQEAVARLLAARSPGVAQRGALGAAALYLTFGLIPVSLGLVGPTLLPGLHDPEDLLVELANVHLGSWPAAIFHAALLAAILSTVDSVLLSTSALLVNNLARTSGTAPLPPASVAPGLTLSRWVLVLAGAVCLAVALAGEGVYALVEEASELGTAGVAVTAIFALFHRSPSGLGAGVALTLGALGVKSFGWLGLPAPFLSTILACTAAYLLVAAFSRGTPSSEQAQ